MPIITSKVTTVTEYIEAICNLSKELDYRGRNFEDSEQLLFRGLSKASYELIPSIARNIEGTSIPLLKYEGAFIQEAKEKFPELNTEYMEPVDLLAVLQHYGMPTRLMDFTENALVALYFSCKTHQKNDEDGEVICLSVIEKTDARHHSVNAIADTYRLMVEDSLSIDDFVQRASRQRYYSPDTGLFNPQKEVSFDWSVLFTTVMSHPKMATSPYVLQRQRAQQGRYLVFPNKINNENCFVQEIERISKNDSIIVARITIAKDSKLEIINQLQILGVSEETLFADSKDIVFKYIKERHAESFARKRQMQQEEKDLLY